jgi:ubiquinone/menaquinone biosynthesis C-methylase UbiE
MQPSVENIQERYRDAGVASQYDRIRCSDCEDALNHRAMWAAIRKALRHVPKGRVLDVPCGTGRFTWHLAEAGFQTVAADVAAEMMAVARANRPRAVKESVPFFVGDIFRLPFPDRSFAAAVCIRFMNLMERPARLAAVKEMARVADVLVVSYYHKYTLKYFSRWLRRQLGGANRVSSRLSRQALTAELVETGLRTVEVIPVAPLLSEAWITVLARPGALPS